MMKGFNPMKCLCKKCGKKYLKTGRYQRICPKCSNSNYFGKSKKKISRKRTYKRLDAITIQNKQMLRALLL